MERARQMITSQRYKATPCEEHFCGRC